MSVASGGPFGSRVAAWMALSPPTKCSALQRPPAPPEILFFICKNTPFFLPNGCTLSDRVQFSDPATLTSSRRPTCSALAKRLIQCPASSHARRACPTIQPSRNEIRLIESTPNHELSPVLPPIQGWFKPRSVVISKYKLRAFEIWLELSQL